VGVETWVIDGMNLIGSRPDRWWQDPDGAIRSLIRDLQDYATATGEPVAVVFDYRPKGLRVRARPGVKVRFADGRRQAADEIIVRTVAEHPDPRVLLVVTSDRGLRGRVQGHGARVVSAGAFRRRLEEAARASPRPPRSPRPGGSAGRHAR
jgi:predicted RNA-binding protein with PIN domain